MTFHTLAQLMPDCVTGRYEARAKKGHGLSLSNAKVSDTLSPRVVFITEDGTELVAWEGQGYWVGNSPKRVEKAVLLQARNKCSVLRNYLKLNGERWEVMVTREREEKAAREKAERRALNQVRNTGPKLLAALKVLTLTPHILAYLEANDPKALAQARAAVTEAETVPEPETLEQARARRAGAR